MKLLKTKIITNEKIARDHYVLSFEFANATRKVSPGQFFNVRVTASSKPLLRRPFGTHKIYKDRIEILYKVVGEATRILSTKKKGDALDVLGPLGNGFNPKSGPRSSQQGAILVAGGHGVAPLYALAKELKTHGFKSRVFIGAKTKKHVVGTKDLKKLGSKVYIATDDGSIGYRGLVTKLLSKELQRTECAVIYACGPKPMLKATAKLAISYKVPCRLSLEEYVACGIGTCLGCAVKTRTGYKMVCKDGPVFDAKEIVWQN